MTKFFCIWTVLALTGVNNRTTAQTLQWFSQPDSLRNQKDELSSDFHCILDLNIDSLEDNPDTVRVSKNTLLGITMQALVKHGTPIGQCKSYYPDGILCEEAVFDTVPILRTITDPGNDGAKGITYTIYTATPISYKKYYKNGKLQEEIVFARIQTYPSCCPHSWLYELHIRYFRNGHIYSYNFQSDTLTKSFHYDNKLRLRNEQIQRTDSSISMTYCYGEDGEPCYYNNGLTKNMAYKTVMKKTNKDSQHYDYANRTVYLYKLTKKLYGTETYNLELYRTEIYKNNKLTNPLSPYNGGK